MTEQESDDDETEHHGPPKYFTLVIVPKDHLEIVKSKGQRTTKRKRRPQQRPSKKNPLRSFDVSGRTQDEQAKATHE